MGNAGLGSKCPNPRGEFSQCFQVSDESCAVYISQDTDEPYLTIHVNDGDVGQDLPAGIGVPYNHAGKEVFIGDFALSAGWAPPLGAAPTTPGTQMVADAPMYGNRDPKEALVWKSTLGQAHQLDDGVILSVQVSTGKRGQEKRIYSVTNKKLCPLELSMDIQPGQEDAHWAESNGPVAGKPSAHPSVRTVVVPPQQTETLGEVLESTDQLFYDARPQIRCSWRHLLPQQRRGRLRSTKSSPPQPSTSPADARPAREAKAMEQAGISDVTHNTVDEILTACRRIGCRSFTDLSFPPNDKTVFGSSELSAEVEILWYRAAELAASSFERHDSDRNLLLFGPHGIMPEDIKPGALGDRWFLGVLSALAPCPDIVERLLLGTQGFKEGIFQVTCWKNGRSTTVIIDDWVPCCASTGKPCFSHTESGALWVVLLEKAWAKLHGSYKHLEVGAPYQAMMDMSCSPGECFGFKQAAQEIGPERMNGRLRKYLRYGDVLLASSPTYEDEDPQDPEACRLMLNQAYSLLRICRVQGQLLFCLRSPAKSFEWKGNWSDSSFLWTPEAQLEARYEPDVNDGIFWMDEQEFYSNLSNVHVLHLRESGPLAWCVARHSVSLLGPFGNEERLVGVIQFETERDLRGFCTLWQRDGRMLGSTKYSRMALAVYGPLGSADCAEVTRTHATACRELVAPVPTLSPGTYWVAVWNCDVSRASAGQQASLLIHLAPPTRNSSHKITSATSSPASTTVSRASSFGSDFDGWEADRRASKTGTQALKQHPCQTDVWMPDYFTSRDLDLRVQQHIIAFIKGGVAYGEDPRHQLEDYGEFILSTAWGPDGSYCIAVCATDATPDRLLVSMDFSPSDGIKFSRGFGAQQKGSVFEACFGRGSQWILVACVEPSVTKYKIACHGKWSQLC